MSRRLRRAAGVLVATVLLGAALVVASSPAGPVQPAPPRVTTGTPSPPTWTAPGVTIPPAATVTR